MCNIPRKPQRKPNPSAAELSGSYVMAASFKRSLSLARAHRAVDCPHVSDDALVGVVMAVEHEGTEGLVQLAFRRRNALDDCLQHRVDPGALLGRDTKDLVPSQADQVLDFLRNEVR